MLVLHARQQHNQIERGFMRKCVLFTAGALMSISVTWALNPVGDARVPIGDHDGDFRTDVTVWRPSTGFWHLIRSSNGSIFSQQWGVAGDIPVPGDYDGDGRTDVAVWRPSTGYWYIIRSSNGSIFSQQWGVGGDIPVPGDYDGDGRTDVAVWRPSTGYWHIIRSSNGSIFSQQWGIGGDVP